MPATILINRSFGETRVALLDDSVTSEVYIERDRERGLVGSIFKGRVTRVLPGMQAAFVDIGLPRAAFLYADDIRDPHQSQLPKRASDEEQDLTLMDARQLDTKALDEARAEAQAEVAERRPQITELIREGDELICQVSKDPLGTKGARITTYVSLPGRYVVFMPTTDHVGISKRITDEAERTRLRTLVEASRGDRSGFIVRTEGAGLGEEKLQEDMQFLRSLWAEVEERANETKAPALVQADLDLVLRATRDLFTREVETLVVDDQREYERIKRFLSKISARLADGVELYSGNAPLFEHYSVEGELERAMQRKVTMKSGASIVIDQAEALTAIDVNTGGFVGKQNLEATILRTNLEAVKEVVSQLRLRNIGGIIVVDLIDMESAESRQLVYDAFLDELEKDRARTHVLPISELGVVEMTRKRVRDSLGRRLSEPCPYCEGRGRLRSRMTICQEIFRQLQQHGRNAEQALVIANPEVAAMLTEDEGDTLAKLEEYIGQSVVVEARADFHHEAYRVHVR